MEYFKNLTEEAFQLGFVSILFCIGFAAIFLLKHRKFNDILNGIGVLLLFIFAIGVTLGVGKSSAIRHALGDWIILIPLSFGFLAAVIWISCSSYCDSRSNINGDLRSI